MAESFANTFGCMFIALCIDLMYALLISSTARLDCLPGASELVLYRIPRLSTTRYAQETIARCLAILPQSICYERHRWCSCHGLFSWVFVTSITKRPMAFIMLQLSVVCPYRDFHCMGIRGPYRSIRSSRAARWHATVKY